ncbi:MAG: hypothetical protein ACFFF9_16220 [Candidatus Thorarchaeota archaeon]
MEGRLGVKIGFAGAILAMLVFAAKGASMIPGIQFTDNWQLIFFLILLLSLAIISILTLYFLYALRKPEIIDKLYENPYAGGIAGVMISFPIALSFIVFGEYYFEDAFTTVFTFLCGFLLIISSIIMVREVKEESAQIDSESES